MHVTEYLEAQKEDSIRQSVQEMIVEEVAASHLAGFNDQDLSMDFEDWKVEMDYLEGKSENCLPKAMDINKPKLLEQQASEARIENSIVIEAATIGHDLSPMRQMDIGDWVTIETKDENSAEMCSTERSPHLLSSGTPKKSRATDPRPSRKRLKVNANKERREKLRTINAVAGADPSQLIEDGNIWCPIPGCSNWGGKGFRRTTGLSRHLK